MSNKTLTPSLNISVKEITATYPNGTGSKSDPTLIGKGQNSYEPMGTIVADKGDEIKINCVDSSGIAITAIALAYESGAHLGVSHASVNGSTFTIDASIVGSEEFYVIFYFSFNNNDYYCKIDPELKVDQGN